MLDFLDQYGQVGLFEADTGSRNTIVLDIWRDVFVVRVYIGQLRDVRVLKWVIPRDFLASSIDFIAVIANASALEINEFPDI